ncbi:HypC/HybG/HupF family hydrogenase formation chaperone [Lacrimispora amygdalina]|uniref:HypC/HybG/HupF family hydrogenase formation chaperone n=1 Tax=Lacrimispora amygdalina TaxID=253257 RepID=UPI000BE31D90|nr:HypC/HybG/HupF family hydrogenase formation chaperone [Lacrimispora amygdalina]
MCVAIPGKVLDIRESYASVNVMDNMIDVNIKLVDAQIGDYVLIHAGCAIEVINGDTAHDILSLLSELQEVRYEDSGSDR